MGASKSKIVDYSENFYMHNDRCYSLSIQHSVKITNDDPNPKIHIFPLDEKEYKCIKLDTRKINEIDIYERGRKDYIHLVHISNANELGLFHILN